MNVDKKLVIIILLLISGVLIFMYAQLVNHSMVLYIIFVIPLIVANGLIRTWENKKGRRIITIIGVIALAVLILWRLLM